MSSHELEKASAPSTPSVFHVSVDDDGHIEVSGGTPEEVVALLQAAGNEVVVNGEILNSTQTAPDPLDGLHLSEREMQVLTMIASGHSNLEVAAAAYISINTVKSYIRSAYRKIDAHSRSQAVIWAIDHGIVSAHPARQEEI